MSSTNSTATIGLSQYVSTDKPTYLTDYNGDMLKIDDAIASDREGIAGAQNKANTADGKADANKTSIDTINAQINGEPSEPSDTGLAGKVNTIDGNVNTINALIGNGSPTTSDQTIIGAVNGLESSLAPREDGTDLANSYAVGEQFARGGSVYTALTTLTAGTAFASLTLNTDYKNSDTLVEQIADVNSVTQTLEQKVTSNYKMVGTITLADIAPDGVKTVAELLNAVSAEIASTLATLTNNDAVININLIAGTYGLLVDGNPSQIYTSAMQTITETFEEARIYANKIVHFDARISPNSSTAQYMEVSTTTPSYSDVSAVVPSADSAHYKCVGIKFSKESMS